MNTSELHNTLGWRVCTHITAAALLATLIPARALAESVDSGLAASETEAQTMEVEPIEGDAAAIEAEQSMPADDETHATDGDGVTATSETDSDETGSDSEGATAEGGRQESQNAVSLVAKASDTKSDDGSTYNHRVTERSWDGTKVCEKSRREDNVRLLSEAKELSGGWYLLDKDMTYKDRLVVSGDTHLILKEDMTLRAKEGIYVQQGATLSVYDQGDEGGTIIAEAKTGAGIGAYKDHKGGNIIIHGGTIEAYGADHCAGIGSNDGDGTEVGDFTMYGGTVTAKGGDSGAGIGGGRASEGGHIAIYGGTVTATGAHYAAGIGGGNGQGKPVKGAHGGTIEIWGGTVTAVGGDDGAGIGGGEGGNAGDISIHGGEVTATGGKHSAGIGCGELESTGDGGRVAIYGGRVAAYKGGADDGTGIGGGDACEVVLGGEGGLSVTSESYRGKVSVEGNLRRGDDYLVAGAQYDHDQLTGTAVAWNGAIVSWGMLQNVLDNMHHGGTVTLSQDLEAHGDGELKVEGDRKIVVDMAGHTLRRDSGLGERCGTVFTVGSEMDLTIKNGTITGGKNDCGGIRNSGDLKLIDMTISGNNAYDYGGGVCVGVDASLALGGRVIIADNGKVGTDGQNNVSLREGSRLSVLASGLTEDSRVGLTTERPTKDHPFVIEGISLEDAQRNFFSDSDSCTFGENADGKLVLGERCEVSFDLDGGCGGDQVEPVFVAGGSLYTLPSTEAALDGNAFGTWEVGGEQYAAGETITVTDDMVAKARYRNEGSVDYVLANGIGKTAYDVVELDDQVKELTDGWYIARGSVKNDQRMHVGGKVNLILADGATYTVPRGIGISGSASLTIWAQKEGTGALVCKGSVKDHDAALGGDWNLTGPITINGGRIEANGGANAAGIGNGEKSPEPAVVTINGGKVKATGGALGPGIGGSNGSDGTVTIAGGEVEATGGRWAAGIGGGNEGTGYVTVTGGAVCARGGDKGAGIGSGSCAQRSGKVRIEDGTVRANGGNEGPGIGSASDDSKYVEIEICGGDVEGTGGEHGAGIGGGLNARAKKTTITGGKVTGRAGQNAGNEFVPAGIGGGPYSHGGDIYILGGEVSACEYSGAVQGWAWTSGIGNSLGWNGKEYKGSKIYLGYDTSSPTTKFYASTIRGDVYLLNDFTNADDRSELHKATGEKDKFKVPGDLTGKTLVPAADGLHDIDVSASRGGSVKASRTMAFASTDERPVYVDLTTSYDSGYRLEGIEVTKKGSGEKVELESRNGGYRFAMPDADVEVKASFAQIRYVTFHDGDKELSRQLVFKGKPAERPEDPTKEGMSFNGWHCKNEDGSLAEETYDFTRPVDGDVDLYAGWDEKVVSFGPHSLTLDGTIGVNFHMNLPEIEGVDWSESYMEFKVAGRGGKVMRDDFDPNDTSQSKGRKRYVYTCQLCSVQMADEITATLHYTQDGEERELTQTYSAKRYVEEFETVADRYNEGVQLLVRSIADLGHYVQPLIAADRGWTLGEGCDHEIMPAATEYGQDKIDTARAALEDYRPVVGDFAGTGVTKSTVTLALESGTCLRVGFETQEGVEVVGATIDGKEVTPKKVDARHWRLDIEGVKASGLDREHAFTVTTSTGHVAQLSCSALSYAYGVMNSESYKDNEDALKAAASVYYYWNAAYLARIA